MQRVRAFWNETGIFIIDSYRNTDKSIKTYQRELIHVLMRMFRTEWSDYDELEFCIELYLQEQGLEEIEPNLTREQFQGEKWVQVKSKATPLTMG